MKRILVLFLIISVLLTYGCSMPIENYNMVLIFGIDKDEKTGGYEVTLQMPKMAGGKEEGTSLGNETFTVSGVGRSIELAVKDAYVKSSKVPFLGHIQVVLIGEDIGREGIVEMADLFKRDPKYTLTPWLFTVDGRAKDLMEAKLEYDVLPAFAIIHTVRDVSRYTIKFYAVQFNKFLEGIEALPHATLMGRIKLVEDGDNKLLEISGASIYKDGKLVGMLNAQDAAGYNWLTGRFKNADAAISYKGQPMNVGIEGGTTNIWPIVRGNTLVYKVVTEATGYVQWASSYPDFESDPELIEELNAATGERIKKLISDTVKDAQDQGIDYLGFEKILEHKDPVLWEQIKDDWDEVFPNIELEIHTDVTIKNTGWILNNPELY